MDFNWQGATVGLLEGVQSDYNAQKKQSLEFARMEKLAATQMAKDKELYGFKKQAEVKAEESRYALGQERKELERPGILAKQQEEADIKSKQGAKERELIREEGIIEEKRKEGKMDESATKQAEAIVKGKVAGANAMLKSFNPDVDPNSEEGKALLKEYAGISKKEKNISKKDRAGLLQKELDAARKSVAETGIPPNYKGTEEDFISETALGNYYNILSTVSPKAPGELTENDIKSLYGMEDKEREKMISTLPKRKQKEALSKLAEMNKTTGDGTMPEGSVEKPTPQQKAREMYPEAVNLSPGGLFKGVGKWATQPGKKSPEGSIGGLGI